MEHAKSFLVLTTNCQLRNKTLIARGMLRTLLRLTGRASLDGREACRLRGSENHVNDEDATLADPAARDWRGAPIAVSPYPTSGLPDLYPLWSIFI